MKNMSQLHTLHFLVNYQLDPLMILYHMTVEQLFEIIIISTNVLHYSFLQLISSFSISSTAAVSSSTCLRHSISVCQVLGVGPCFVVNQL